ncbi:phosphotransferase family protein [Kribbella sp. VKM Ac-2568]|uniref:phosphotransferase family protein n=1 Tax=Kribbella sp. VKM Ac-2568 TaxID=2512219 RepID=UPI00104D0B75|nr:aminoglycoside phosphotransferase family protein [Kribbella sp. VKM Ac-2568]TCM37867.1 aminoglycoside phosphotransferase (APT) family kinase protein [Kribbella sp. VKM Ac-2568]
MAEWERTRAWVEEVSGGRVVAVDRLKGGWTSVMRQVEVDGPGGRRALVLRSFVDEFFVRHAEGLLTREAEVLRLLRGSGVPAAEVVGVDAVGRYCEHPSLVMTLLPGAVRVEDDGAPARAGLLARQLVAIHQVRVETRPREYQAWTGAERVRLPEATTRPKVWKAAVEGIRRQAPQYEGVFLHRDFHPGNVLFDGDVITGVVDWVETSWGPADLDVAHCSTALALLHGPEYGLRFPELYSAAGGRLADWEDQRYWRLLDALAFAPDAEKVAVPWRDLGRTDLTPSLLQTRLEAYLEAVL